MSISDPLSIFLITSGSRGDRLLFRYPYETTEEKQTIAKSYSGNPFTVRVTEDHKRSTWSSSNLSSGELISFNDDIIGSLLAVKSDLCGKNFEVKINDVIFVGYPVILQGNCPIEHSSKRETSTTISFHIVFALKNDADRLAIQCYQDLAKQISIALCHEEGRCGYLSQQKHAMWAIQDEVATCPEDSRETPYGIILQKCSLAQKLKAVYEGLCNTGVVQLHINKWVQISFCLPHKVHNVNLPPDTSFKITPDVIQSSISSLRPFHGMLLLVSERSLLQSLPLDSSPALIRLISVTTPLKSLYQLASDADLALSQVYKLVIHLVHWGKAAVIFPLCESNVYILAPNADTHITSSLGESFVTEFPGMSLPVIMSEFSLPTPLGEHRDILGLPKQQAKQVQMVVWLLKHRILVQLHTYVFLLTGQSKQGQTVVRANSKPECEVAAMQNGTDEQVWYLGASESTSVLNDKVSSHNTLVNNDTPSKSVSSDDSVIPEEELAQIKLQENLLNFLPEEQRQFILNVPAASNLEDLKLFSRLYPYFNGKCHLEEIMYYENLRRSQLLTVLDKFRDILITCQHEDPGITGWTGAKPR